MTDGEKTHAYPVREDAMKDVVLTLGEVVDEPLMGFCWLCDRGLCTQTIGVERDVVLHMPSSEPLGRHRDE